MEAITENDCKIAVYIWNILRTKIQVLWSWGFEDVRTIKNGVTFKVNGFLLKGKVEIIYNSASDLFDISLYDNDGNLKKQIDDVYFDKLVDTIDSNVEYTGNDYEQRVKDAYQAI
jgi:hypothetical protein